MPEMTSYDPVYAPAQFPQEGRLPTDEQAVWENYYKQTAEREKYRQQLNAARGFRGASTCAQVLSGSVCTKAAGYKRIWCRTL